MFFGGIRRSIPSYAQGFGGLSSSHSSTAIGRGLLRRRIKANYLAGKPCPLGEELQTLWFLPPGTPLATAEAIGARFDWVTHDNTLEFSNSYE